MGRKTRLTLIPALAALFVLNACEELPTGPDTEPPTATITSPAAGQTAIDSLVVTVDASDNVGVAGVLLYISGLTLPVALDTIAPYQLVAPLVDIPSGGQYFWAVAADAAGNTDTTETVDFVAQKTPGLKFVSRIAIPGTIVDVTASGDIAYVAAGDGGVVAVDITNVFIPEFDARFSTGDYVAGVAVDNLTVYAAATDNGVFALSAGSADTLVEFARLNPQGIYALQVATASGVLSVAGGTGGLFQLNTSVADTLIESGKYDQGGNVQDVEIIANYAYTAEGDEGMRVIDIAVADSLVATYRFASSQQATDVHAAGSYAYLADGNSGVHSFIIMDRANPVYLSTFNNGRLYTGVSGAGRWVYAAAGDAGVDVIDAAAPDNLVAAVDGNFNTLGFAHKVAEHDGYVLVADNNFMTILKYVAP